MQGEGRVEQAGTRGSKKDISPIVMRNIRQTFLRFSFVLRRHRTHTRSLTHSYADAYAESRPIPLLNLSQNIRILEKEVFLQKKRQSINQHFQPRRKNKKGKKNQRTFSPTLIALPPQPGNKTLSPALTDEGTTRPSLSGARCTRSDGDHSRFRKRTQRGRGREEYSRCHFLNQVHSFIHQKPQKKERETHNFGFEALD
jgi:hypothetical protein